MYRLTNDLWTGSLVGPAGPGRGGRFMDVAGKSPGSDERGGCVAETPSQYRRRRRRARRVA